MSPTTRPAAQRLKRIAARARTLAAVYFIVLFVGTHLPVEQVEAFATASDKWLHFAGYAVLTLLVLTGWELTIGVLQPKHYFAVWLAGVLYGAFDEISQTPVGRNCDMNDWVTDVLGVVAGLLAFRLGRAALHGAIAWMAPASNAAD
ncbi:MAG TPA: VanZ family protein [Lacipirellula sp.]